MRRLAKYLLLITGLVACESPTPVQAPAAVEKSELLKTAEHPIRMEGLVSHYDKAKAIAVFIDAAQLSVGPMKVDCDKITAHFTAQAPAQATTSSHVERVICESRVVVRKGDDITTAQQAEYFPAEGKIILIGNPVMKLKKGVIRSDRITLYVDAETAEFDRLKAESSSLKP